MTQSGRDEGWLRAWCTKLDVPVDNFQPLLPLSSTYTLSTRKEDDDQANFLLAQASEIRRTGEPRVTAIRTFKKDKWSYEDYCGVLTDIVNGSGEVGVAESAWNSMQLQKPKKARTRRFSRRQQAGDEETNDMLFLLLCSTMRYKETDMFHFLAHSACQDVVNRILPTALQMHSQQNTRILLEENADPNTCPEEFLNLVRTGNEEFVRLVLQAQTPVDFATLTSVLPDAVQRGSAPIVNLLLAHGADANAHNANAMEKAIRSKRNDLALAMLMSPNPPLPETLAPIVAHVFFKMDMLQDKKYSLIELLLNGGAAGESVSLALGGAVRQGWTNLVELFVDKGASINYFNAEAYRHAIHEVDLVVAAILNRGKLDDDLATDLFEEIYKTKYGRAISKEKWRALAEMLLAQGASGSVVDDALVERVRSKDLASVRLLLREGASVDYDSSSALDNAVVSEDEAFVDALLQYQPATQSVNFVFNRVETLSHKVQTQFARKLLDAGANGEEVDKVLRFAVFRVAAERDRELIRVLVDGGADVSQDDGELLHVAVKTSDFETTQVLLLGFPSASLLADCVLTAAAHPGERERYQFVQLLLHAGARGDKVSEALCSSIDGTASGFRLATLLLTDGEANSGYRNGESFKKAIELGVVEFLELLAQYNHLEDADFCSCLIAAIDLLQRDRTRLEKIRILLMSSQDLSGNTGTAALLHEMQGLKRRNGSTLGVLHMLLEAGADVNHKQGSIFVDAIELGLFNCFKLFLSAHPFFQSLEFAFDKALAYAFAAEDRAADTRYVQELLSTGMAQSVLDKALLHTTERHNEDLVLLLLRHGASVNYQEGAVVRKAIQKLDLVLLAHLLRHEPTADTLNNGFSLTMALHDIRAKHDSYQLLLNAGRISQPLRDEALVAAADGGCMQASISGLLLEHKASPNYATGTPVCRAIKSSNYRVELTRMFTRHNISKDTVAAGIACAFDALQAEVRVATMEQLLAVHKPQQALDQLLLKAVRYFSINHSTNLHRYMHPTLMANSFNVC